ncbi:MAG: DUF1302 family protein, partial [Deltaproteobacteria bacterium]|nr:DUF1302 family protein [Deltaproteobacteria bacterium]
DINETLDSQPSSDKTSYFFNGNIKLKTGYRFNYDSQGNRTTDHSGLSDAKAEIDLEFGSKVFESWDLFISGSAFYNLAYEFNGRNNYTEKFLEENEKELELDKLFIRGSLNKALDIKIGRQIVVWGKSDNIRVTDILNPLDLREPGMTDIEDLRLPVFMTRFDYYFFNLSLSAFVIHEHRSHKTPVFGSSYFYFPNALPDESDISTRFENTEFALSLSGTFPGFDISFYLADLYDDSSYLNANNQRLNQRISMAGLAANKVHGNFLYKAEIAFFNNIRLSAFPQNGVPVENLQDYSRVDFLVGIEYSGFKDTSLSFEMADKWMTNYDHCAQNIGINEHRVQYALRVSRTFLHEVLDLTILTSLYGKSADDGGFIRTQGTYDLSDAISITLGAIFYKSGSHVMLKQIGENDAIFSSITYGF